MGSGTAVARRPPISSSATTRSRRSMYGMREGRRIVDNVQKGLVFLISTHVALLGFILIATLSGFESAAPADPDPVARAVHRPLDVGRVRAGAARARPHATATATRAKPLLTNGLLGRHPVAGASAPSPRWCSWRRTEGRRPRPWLAYTALVCGQAVRAYWNRSLGKPVHRLRATGSCSGRILTVASRPRSRPSLCSPMRSAPALDARDRPLVAAVALAPFLLVQVLRFRGHRPWVA